MSIFKRRPIEDVETERARLMTRVDVRGHEMAVERFQKNADRQQRAEERKRRRIEHSQRWAAIGKRVAAFVVSLRQQLTLILPLLFVNAFAVVGQAGWAGEHLHWQILAAAGFAATLESIALYVGYHAHAALMAGDSATKLRLASYSIGAVIGGINYDHYAGKNGDPTAMAVIFGLLSLISPWLWAMHGRYKNRRRLEQLGLIDERAPHFSAAKWLHFPFQTFGALRYGVAHNLKDPAAAWDGYQRQRAMARARRLAVRERRRLEKDHRPAVRVVVATTVTRTVTAPKTKVRLFWTDHSATTLTATVDHPGTTTARAAVATTMATGRIPEATTGRQATNDHTHATGDHPVATTGTDRSEDHHNDRTTTRSRPARKTSTTTTRRERGQKGADQSKTTPTADDNQRAVVAYLRSVKDGRPLSQRSLAKQFGFSKTWARDRIQEAGPQPVGDARRDASAAPKDQSVTSEVKTG